MIARPKTDTSGRTSPDTSGRTRTPARPGPHPTGADQPTTTPDLDPSGPDRRGHRAAHPRRGQPAAVVRPAGIPPRQAHRRRHHPRRDRRPPAAGHAAHPSTGAALADADPPDPASDEHEHRDQRRQPMALPRRPGRPTGDRRRPAATLPGARVAHHTDAHRQPAPTGPAGPGTRDRDGPRLQSRHRRRPPRNGRRHLEPIHRHTSVTIHPPPSQRQRIRHSRMRQGASIAAIRPACASSGWPPARGGHQRAPSAGARFGPRGHPLARRLPARLEDLPRSVTWRLTPRRGIPRRRSGVGEGSW